MLRTLVVPESGSVRTSSSLVSYLLFQTRLLATLRFATTVLACH